MTNMIGYWDSSDTQHPCGTELVREGLTLS